jgi:maleylacetoacetate isomerase
VHLLKGEQHADDYRARNPAGLVPMMEADNGAPLTQSLAIIEWLDETIPAPPLLPGDALSRARVRAIALAIACDIHPLNNLRVLKYLTGPLAQTEAARDAWSRHWCDVGLSALETQLAREPATGTFCHGNSPTLADICLVPQLANARRVAIDVATYPTLARIEIACQALPAFANAAPAKQPDAPPM